MSDVLEKGFLLTFDELRILLYACGIRRVEGVFMPEKKYTEKEIIEALHHLDKRNFISVNEDAFVIDDEIREIVDIISAPQNTFIQRAANGQEYFCYEAQDMIVVSEHYRKKENTLKLTVFKPKDFYIWREELQDDRDRSGSPYVGEIL